MKFDEITLSPYLIYSKPISYSDKITLYPITMEHYFEFQQFQEALIVRKDSTFTEKSIIKMTYYDFLKYSFKNSELSDKYNIPFLKDLYGYMWALLQLSCKTDVEINSNRNFVINGQEITDKEFNDIRQILIIQNGVDFDIDEFIHYDTEQALKKATEKERNMKNDKSTIEDFIDSLVVALHTTEQLIMDIPIRKFWRYVKRYNLHEDYTIRRTGECSGLISFKEPLKHWMTSLNVDDKYDNVKMSESELSKVAG